MWPRDGEEGCYGKVGLRWEMKALLGSSNCSLLPSTVVHAVLEVVLQPRSENPRQSRNTHTQFSSCIFSWWRSSRLAQPVSLEIVPRLVVG